MTKPPVHCIIIALLMTKTITQINSGMEGMIKVSLVELEQKSLELKGLEKNIRELGDSL